MYTRLIILSYDSWSCFDAVFFSCGPIKTTAQGQQEDHTISSRISVGLPLCASPAAAAVGPLRREPPPARSMDGWIDREALLPGRRKRAGAGGGSGITTPALVLNRRADGRTAFESGSRHAHAEMILGFDMQNSGRFRRLTEVDSPPELY